MSAPSSQAAQRRLAPRLPAIGLAWMACALACWVQSTSWAQDAAPAAAPAQSTETQTADTQSDDHPQSADTKASADGNDKSDAAPVGAPTDKAGGATPPAPTAKPGKRSSTSGHTLLIVAVVAAVFVVPFLLGNYLSQVLRMPDHARRMGIVLFAITASTVVTVTGWPPKRGIDLSGGAILVYEVQNKDFKDMDKLVGAVTRRVNPDGTKEVLVRQYGESEVEIIIPEADEEALREMQEKISTQGQLEFRMVADRQFPEEEEIINLAEEEEFQGKAEVTEPEKGGKTRVVARWIPVVSYEVPNILDRGHLTRTVEKGNEEVTEVLVLMDKRNVTGEYLTNASAGSDEYAKPAVHFNFNAEGARKFGRLTGDNLPDPIDEKRAHKLAVILDGKLFSAPYIRSRIDDRGQITGQFSEAETKRLADVLNAGSLPTTLRKEPTSSMHIGPTLGEDTIRKGVLAMEVSTACVMLFMMFYYRFAGLVANLALLLNVLLILAVMIPLHAAFTLSGLAGLALTVGMAVDANVLIYERIREELGRGATLRMAIRNGFDRATTTIVDANVTTLISAIVLYAVGTDQVKGFAVTLFLGIVMNLFTAITFTRLIFDMAEKQRWVTRLKMMKVLENPHFDFIGKRRIAITLSLVLIGAGLVGVYFRGRGLMDIDFTGGVSVQALFEKPQDVGDLRARIAALPEDEALPDVTVQSVDLEGETKGLRFLIVTSMAKIDEENPPTSGPKTNIELVEATLKKIFNDADHQLAFNHLTWNAVAALPGAEAGAEGHGDAETRGRGDAESAERGARSEERRDADDAGPRGDTKVDNSETDNSDTGTSETGDGGIDQPEPGDGARRGGATETLLALADEPQAEKDTPTRSASKETPERGASDKDTTEKDTDAAEPKADDQNKPTEKPAKKPSKADRFADGSKVELKFTEKINYDALSERIKQALAAAGLPDDVAFAVANPSYEQGSDKRFDQWTLSIALGAKPTESLLEQLKSRLAAEPMFPSSNRVGASVAGNTQVYATLALLASLVMIVLYVWIRFQQVSFGFAAVLALVHDVLVSLGGLALSFWLADLPFMEKLLVEPFKINLPIIAAFLTIIGYSINDTIVIFDRIREIRGKSPDLGPELVNLCVNQTLSRTLLTSLTVFIVVLILYVFGGLGIHGFAFTLVVGTISGTYSTVYIATPVLIWMNKPRAARGSPRPEPSGARSAA